MSYKNIISQSLSPIRIQLLQRLAKKDLSLEDAEKIWTELKEKSADAALGWEIDKIRDSLSGQLTAVPELQDPLYQLAWAVGLVYLLSNPKIVEAWPHSNEKELGDTDFWREFLKAPHLRQEAIKHAVDLIGLVKDNQTRLRWGRPGSWFYHNPTDRIINLDLVVGLIIGLEHTRSIELHEIGHNALTFDHPEKLMRLEQEINAIRSNFSKNKVLTQEEYKRLLLLSYEIRLRHHFWNSAEDNAVNRFTAELSEIHPQDYRPSLNHVQSLFIASQISADGNLAPEDAVPATAQVDALIRDICMVVNLAFFHHNGMFENTAADWKMLGADLSSLPRRKPHLSLLQEVASIMDRCDGVAGSIGNLQPLCLPSGRRNTPGHSAEDLSKLRLRLIEELWDEYVAPLLPDHLKHIEDEIDQFLAQKKENGDAADGKNGAGAFPVPCPNGTPVEVEDIGELPSPAPLPNIAGKNAPAGKGQGGQEAAAKDKSKNDDPNAPTLEDLLDEANQDERRTHSSRRKEQELQNAQRQAAQNAVLAHAKDDLPQGNHSQYLNRLTDLQLEIGCVRDKYNALRQLQREQQERPAARLEVMPEDGDLSGFDISAHMELLVKQRTGQKIEENDYRRFENVDTLTLPTEIDQVILIDGSGSMNMPASFFNLRNSDPQKAMEMLHQMHNKGGKRLIDLAVSSAIILYEAGQAVGVRTYIGMWGPANPYFFAKPGDKPHEIGEALDKFKDGLNSATNLAPAIKMATEVLANQKLASERSGSTHIFILSDGDIQDAGTAGECLRVLMQQCPFVTIDIGVFGTGRMAAANTHHPHFPQYYLPITTMANSVTSADPNIEIGIQEGMDPEHICINMVDAVLDRLRANNSLTATPVKSKKAQLRLTLEALKAVRTREYA